MKIEGASCTATRKAVTKTRGREYFCAMLKFLPGRIPKVRDSACRMGSGRKVASKCETPLLVSEPQVQRQLQENKGHVVTEELLESSESVVRIKTFAKRSHPDNIC